MYKLSKAPVKLWCTVSESASEVGQRPRPQVIPVHGAAEGRWRAAAVGGRREHVRHHGVVQQQLLDSDRLPPWECQCCPRNITFIPINNFVILF